MHHDGGLSSSPAGSPLLTRPLAPPPVAPGSGDSGAHAARAFARRSHFGSLDGLRALAVLGVVWHHTVEQVGGIPLAGRGFLGVDLFFALSGFLITTLLLRERDRFGDVSLSRFYARRALRIFPLYYGIILVCLAGSLVVHHEQLQLVSRSAPQLLTYLSNWFPSSSLLFVSWSLAAEEQFYLVWPPVFRYLGRAAPVVLGLFLVANQAVNFGLILPGLRHLDMGQITFTPIILGVGLAYALHRRFGLAWILVGHRAAAPVLAAALLGLAALPAGDPSLPGFHRLGLSLLGCALLAAVVVREDHLLARLLGHRWLVRVGTVSYGMYLFHMFVRAAVLAVGEALGVGFHPLVLFGLVAVLTWLAAEVSFRTFESRLLAHKPVRTA